MALNRPVTEIVENSKDKRLGVHPSWVRVSLREVADVLNGFAFKSAMFSTDEGMPLIRIRNVGKDSTETSYIGDYDENYIIRKGDLIIGMDGDFNSARWRGPDALLNQRVCKVELSSVGYDIRFLDYALPAYLEAINKETSSVTVKHLSSRSVQDIPLPLPPLNEQHRIVEELEKQLSRLDEAVARLKRAQANLKRYKAAVLKAAVEGKLVPNEVEKGKSRGRTVEATSDLLARIETPERPNRYSTRSEDTILGHASMAVGNPNTELPKGWEWSPLVDIAKMESGHTPSRRHPEWWDGDIPWIGIPDARDHHGKVLDNTIQNTNEEGLANSASRLLPKGTVCVSRTASVGYVTIMGRPMATSQDFVNWIPTEAVLSDWLKIIFMADKDALLRFGKGSVHKTIYFPEWLSLHIAVPPLDEQHRIISEVERQISVIATFDEAIGTSLKRADRLRQSILQKAFSGQLVPQDPEDEPASELLGRIMAARLSDKPKRKLRSWKVRGER